MRNSYSCYRCHRQGLLVATLLLASLLPGLMNQADAQTVPDTTQLRYGEEEQARSESLSPLRVVREERGVWKLGLNNFLFDANLNNLMDNHYSRVGVHIAYEHQLGQPAWSVLGEVSPAIAGYQPAANASVEQALSLRTQLAGRYYYNLEHRLLRGRRTGSFSANYFSVALGAGVGRQAHETPFYLFPDTHGRLVTADVALLYGLQRRLGRHWFVDANVGFTRLLADVSQHKVAINSSLRIGLLLGSPPSLTPPVPADADQSLRPRVYVGLRGGLYGYRVAYSAQYPYPPDRVSNNGQELEYVTYGYFERQPGEGYGTYDQYVSTFAVPYFYAGYYFRPRWAVQLGVQKESNQRVNFTTFSTPASRYRVGNGLFERRDLALPVLVRYCLTPSFLRRWQFDATSGLVPVWSSATFRERQVVNHELTDQETFSFQRHAFGLHASLGVEAAYGLGRRRRFQLTFESVINKDLRTFFEDKYSLQGGVGLGVRYRFEYR